MSLAGESMEDFTRNKLINEPPPKTVDLLINFIISQKEIKRGKSSEGKELFDGEEMDQSESVWGSPIWYVRKISRKTNIFYSLIHTCTFAYQGVRNISFSENFAYVLNG